MGHTSVVLARTKPWGHLLRCREQCKKKWVAAGGAVKTGMGLCWARCPPHFWVLCTRAVSAKKRIAGQVWRASVVEVVVQAVLGVWKGLLIRRLDLHGCPMRSICWFPTCTHPTMSNHQDHQSGLVIQDMGQHHEAGMVHHWWVW